MRVCAFADCCHFLFLPSPFLRGKGDRLRWMRVDLTLLLSLTIKRTVSPHQALRARSLRGKPCTEPCSERLYRSRQDPSADARDDKDDFYFQRSFSSPITGFPKSIEELFGKRSGRRCGQGGKHSAPSATAPCQRRGGEENSEQKTRYRQIARFGWGFPQITAFRRRQLAEERVTSFRE